MGRERIIAQLAASGWQGGKRHPIRIRRYTRTESAIIYRPKTLEEAFDDWVAKGSSPSLQYLAGKEESGTRYAYDGILEPRVQLYIDLRP